MIFCESAILTYEYELKKMNGLEFYVYFFFTTSSDVVVFGRSTVG